MLPNGHYVLWQMRPESWHSQVPSCKNVRVQAERFFFLPRANQFYWLLDIGSGPFVSPASGQGFYFTMCVIVEAQMSVNLVNCDVEFVASDDYFLGSLNQNRIPKKWKISIQNQHRMPIQKFSNSVIMYFNRTRFSFLCHRHNYNNFVSRSNRFRQSVCAYASINYFLKF